MADDQLEEGGSGGTRECGSRQRQFELSAISSWCGGILHRSRDTSSLLSCCILRGLNLIDKNRMLLYK